MALKKYHAVVNKIDGVQMEVSARGHKIMIDEPIPSGGKDEGMTPIEMMLGSLGACQAITATIFAKMYGIKIDELRVEVEGERDPDSMTGKSPEARTGFEKIRFHFYVKSNMPEERIRQLLVLAEQKCPVGESIRHGVEFEELKLTME